MQDTRAKGDPWWDSVVVVVRVKEQGLGDRAGGVERCWLLVGWEYGSKYS